MTEAIEKMMLFSLDEMEMMKRKSRIYFEKNFEKQKLMDTIENYFEK